MPSDSILLGIELLTENRDHIVRIGARIIDEFFHAGIECAVFHCWDFGLQPCHAFVYL